MGWRGMPVLAETAAAVSALSWRRVAGWPSGLLCRLDTLLHIPAMPDQTA